MQLRMAGWGRCYQRDLSPHFENVWIFSDAGKPEIESGGEFVEPAAEIPRKGGGKPASERAQRTCRRRLPAGNSDDTDSAHAVLNQRPF